MSGKCFSNSVATRFTGTSQWERGRPSSLESMSCLCFCCAVNRDMYLLLTLMSSFSSKTEHRSRGDNREQKVQGPIAVVAPPFPPFPAIYSQKRQTIKDRHLLPVSLSLQISHTITLLALWDLSVWQCFTSCLPPSLCRYNTADVKDCQLHNPGHSFQQPVPGWMFPLRNLLFFTHGQHTYTLIHAVLHSPSRSPLLH